jgi:hypothetical protein
MVLIMLDIAPKREYYMVQQCIRNLYAFGKSIHKYEACMPHNIVAALNGFAKGGGPVTSVIGRHEFRQKEADLF